MYKKKCIVIIIGLIIIVPHILLAENDSLSFNADSMQFIGTTEAENYSVNLFKLASRAIISLGIIILLIFITIYLLRKIFYTNHHNKFLNNMVNIIGMVPLSSKKSIYLVKIADQILVVGVTENNISLLSEINDLSVVNKFNSDIQANKNYKFSFKNHLDKMLGKENAE